MIIFENAQIYTMQDEPFTGHIAVDGTKITAVSREPIAGNARRIDVSGKVITPGFVDAHTHEGMVQGDIGHAGFDENEMSDPVTPHLRAIDSINPFDPSLRDAACGGVTVINTGPGSANVFGGQFSAIKTHGDIVDRMIVKSPTALKIAFGENPKDVYIKSEKEPQTRMAIAAIMRDWFARAQEYAQKKDHHLAGEDDEKGPDFDIKLEALELAIRRKCAVHAHCHRADDIATAIRIAEEFNLDLVLIHATEGHKIADYIAEKKIPAVIGPSMVGREKAELAEISFKTAGILSRAGVTVCLQSDTFPPLPYFQTIVCMAVKEGMTPMEAMRAVTIVPAELLGIADRVGSLAPGKDADLVVWSGDPVDFYSRVESTYINGECVYEAR